MSVKVDSTTQQKGNQQDLKKADKNTHESKLILQKNVQEAQMMLIEDDIDGAKDLIMKTLSELKEQLGGESSILLLPGYVILAEANIVDNKLKKAEEFLIAAYWNFLKYKKEESSENVTDDEYSQLRGFLHKTFAKLFYSQKGYILQLKDYAKAIDELKNGIYIDSLKFGPEHIETNQSYYQMGLILKAKKDIAGTNSFFGKFCKIWHKTLKKLVIKKQQISFDSLNQVVIKQALIQLSDIDNYYQNQEGNSIETLIKIHAKFSIGLMLHYIGQTDEFQNQILQVIELVSGLYGENHVKTLKIKNLMNQE